MVEQSSEEGYHLSFHVLFPQWSSLCIYVVDLYICAWMFDEHTRISYAFNDIVEAFREGT